jgi:hypothetical protein
VSAVSAIEKKADRIKRTAMAPAVIPMDVDIERNPLLKG